MSVVPPSFLRSPPFPGVPPAVAAVGVVGRSELADPEPLFALLREARVGGAFWGAPATAYRTIVIAGADGTLPDAAPEGSGVALFSPWRVGAPATRGWATLAPDIDPWSAVAGADTIWSDGRDDLALVGWLTGVRVRAHDGGEVPGSAAAALVAAALQGAAYRNPFTGASWSVAEAIEQLADWRRLLDANRGIAATAGMAWWKRRQIARFLWDGRRTPPPLGFRRALSHARTVGGAVAAWPSRVPAEARAAAGAAGVPLVTVEDGFLRSRGLGSDLNLPWSVVADRRGIYYRPDRPSDLEHILATDPFPPRLTARAAALRRALVAGRLAKYGDAAARPFERPEGRRVILAVGQVDDDLSVRFGGGGIGGNRAFLARVRAAEPDAFIVYRPHPDVLAGHRSGDVPAEIALTHVDRIDAGGSVLAAVEAADAVHVLSSLTGFEALLRGREVVVHGAPFYAGWGLTRDLSPQNPARGRRLTLDQLVAGAMIVYPRYLDPVTCLPCPPEVLVDRFATGVEPASGWLVRLRRLQGRVRRRLEGGA